MFRSCSLKEYKFLDNSKQNETIPMTVSLVPVHGDDPYDHPVPVDASAWAIALGPTNWAETLCDVSPCNR